MTEKISAVSRLEVGSFFIILLVGILFGFFVYDESGFIKQSDSLDLIQQDRDISESISSLLSMKQVIISQKSFKNLSNRQQLTRIIRETDKKFAQLKEKNVKPNLALFNILDPLVFDLGLWTTSGKEDHPASSQFVYDLSLQRLQYAIVDLRSMENGLKNRQSKTIYTYHKQLDGFRDSILTLLLGTISLVTLVISLNMKQRHWQSRLANGRLLISDSVNSLNEGVILTDNQGNCLVVNDTMAKLIPELNDQLEIGSSFENAFSKIINNGALSLIEVQTHHLVKDSLDQDNNDHNTSKEYISKSGIYIRVTKRHLKNVRQLITFSDITYLKVAQQELLHQATIDGMTGLANRSHFLSKLQDALSRSKRHGHKVALMVFDLDKFKQVNDTLGHAIGDELLISVANRIRSSLREIDASGRIGGDEFAAYLDQIKDLREIRITADRIIEELHQKLDIGGVDVEVSSSIGIALYPDDADELNALLKHADAACYHAKQMGRNNYQIYNRDLKVRAMQQITMESRLRFAIKEDTLLLNFQPQMELATKKIKGMEVFLRWNDSKLGSVPPDEFIPLAEKTGLIAQMGEWVIRQTCAQLRKWIDQDITPVPLAINISPKQFRLQNLPNIIDKALNDFSISAKMLELEITEAVIMSDINAANETLQKLSKRGLTLIIDDFGTGSSSLHRLRQLPIQALKIDQSFIDRLTEDEDAREITGAIIAIAQKLHLTTIAEGVETEEQANALLSLGCNSVQGYWISKPMSEIELNSYFRDEDTISQLRSKTN